MCQGNRILTFMRFFCLPKNARASRPEQLQRSDLECLNMETWSLLPRNDSHFVSLHSGTTFLRLYSNRSTGLVTAWATLQTEQAVNLNGICRCLQCRSVEAFLRPPRFQRTLQRRAVEVGMLQIASCKTMANRAWGSRL